MQYAPSILTRNADRLRELLSRKTVRATAMVTSAMVFQKGVQFVSNLILTRLLFPSAFGIMALCWAILTGLTMFSDVGLRPAILNSPRGDEPSFMNTAWTIQIVVGCLICLGAIVTSLPLAAIYDEPDLTGILITISTSMVILGLRPVTLLVAERNMQVHYELIVNTVSQVLTLIATAALAYFYRSVYALAFGAVLGAVISTALAWIIAPRHRHRLMLDRESIAEVRKFTGWIFFATAFTFLGNQGSRLIQGLMLTVSQLGILSLAQTIANIPGEFATRLASAVALPKIAQVNREDARQQVAITRRLHEWYALFLVVAYVPLWAVAPLAVRFLYDPRYWDAGRLLQLLCSNSMATNLTAIYTSAFLAIGKVRVSFKIQVTSAISTSAGIAAGYHLGGISGLIIGMTAGAFVTYCVIALEAAKHGMARLRVDALFWLAVVGLTLQSAG